MERAVLYARFSSDLQSESSIDDQLALCRKFAAREGLNIVGEYDDRAISGASMHGRDGLAKVLAAAHARQCDVVIVEALDRLSRSIGDLDSIFQQLRFAGVRLQAVHDGIADEIQIGVRGLVGALYLTDLAKKTRRGLAGKIRVGQRAGGLPYGYRPIPGQPGSHVIEESEAIVVRRIFERFAAGDSPRDIAHALNRDGVPPVRGRAWNASTINGSAKRASGMLANHVYAGVIVWNKVGKMKNPSTGKRVPRINPESEWQSTDAPQLRIVDQDIWEKVQLRKAERSQGPRAFQQPPRRLLSGLLKCAICGSGVVACGVDHGRPRARCTRVTESGDCTNRRPIYLDTLEKGVVDILREQLTDPKVIAAAVKEYHQEMRRLEGDKARTRAADERKLADIKGKIRRLVDQVADGTLPGAIVGPQLNELDAERAEIEARLEAAAPPEVIALHPAALNLYLKELDLLAGAVAGGKPHDAALAMRQLIDAIIIYPREKNGPIRFDIRGRLIALIDPSAGPMVPREGIAQARRLDPGPTFLLKCVA